VRDTVKRLASHGICGEQVAEAMLRPGGVCPKAEVDFRQGRVCVRGPACTLIILCVPTGVGRLRAGIVAACVIVVGEV
jgi:hypothetical protein